MVAFLNNKLKALNVLTTKFDPSAIEPLRMLLNRQHSTSDLFSVSPPWNADIRWISPNSLEYFRLFQRAFNAMGLGAAIKPYINADKLVRMYQGFFVVRSECRSPDFHTDWKGCENQGFTLITPVTANTEGFGLIYQRLDGSLAEYQYKVGEAILFGDDFLHSTKPGKSTEPVVLLSFTFGSDQMKYWPSMWECIGRQGNLYRQPDGRFFVRDMEV